MSFDSGARDDMLGARARARGLARWSREGRARLHARDRFGGLLVR
jgi:hypothetical protein